MVVKAKEGKADAVKESLEEKLAQLTKTFETYLQDQYEIAKAGKVVVNGDYVALLVLEDIVGEGAKTPTQAVAAAEQIFMDATSANKFSKLYKAIAKKKMPIYNRFHGFIMNWHFLEEVMRWYLAAWYSFSGFCRLY